MPVAIHGVNLERNSMFYKVDQSLIKVEEGFNPRLNFDPDAQASLEAYIKENGVPGALLCRKKYDRILLVDGERRLRAVRKLNAEGCELTTVTVEFEKAHITEAERLLQAMSRNQTVHLTPLEEANAFRRFIAWGWSQAQIAQRKGVSPAFVSGRLALLEATPTLVAAVTNGHVTTAEATQIVRESRKDGVSQDALTEKVAKARKEDDPAVKEEKQRKQLRKLTEVLGVEEVLLNLIDYANDKGLSGLVERLTTTLKAHEKNPTERWLTFVAAQKDRGEA